MFISFHTIPWTLKLILQRCFTSSVGVRLLIFGHLIILFLDMKGSHKDMPTSIVFIRCLLHLLAVLHPVVTHLNLPNIPM
jgi:hypothetical protein